MTTTEPGMRSSSLTIALILHVLVLIAGYVTIPWMKKDFDVPTPVSIELVDIADIAQTTRPAPVDVKEDKKEKPKQDNKPPPAPKSTAAAQPKPVDKPDDKPEEKPKKDEVLVDENAPPQKKQDKKDDKKKKVTKAPPKKEDFASVLKNLADSKPTPMTPAKQPDMKADETPPQASENLPVGMKMTMTEKDALRQQLQGCWNFPFGAKDAENLIVEIYMVVNPDRTLQSARVVDMNRYNSDTFFRAAADAAMRAVQSPNCSPFELPADKYDVWKTITVTFNPKDIF